MTDLDIIKECRQTGKTRTTTKNLLEKAYYEQMTNLKFTQVSRVICPKSGIHYLDAVSDEGLHYTAEMSSNIEKWLVFTKPWGVDRQQPHK